MTATNTGVTRQIVLDTRTTGMNQISTHYEGRKITEIGMVEVVNHCLTGNNLHVYLRLNRLVDLKVFGVHGITDEFLLDKPVFADAADEFLDYIRGAELVIRNASFDIDFMDYGFAKLKRDIPKTSEFCKITDSLALAREMFPGRRSSLDASCSRYEIDNSKRTLHGALLDAQILVDVYLMIIGRRTTMTSSMEGDSQQQDDTGIQRTMRRSGKLRVVFAADEGLAAHESCFNLVQKKGESRLWWAQLVRLPYESGHSGDSRSRRSKT